MSRKLVTVRTIVQLLPIEGADKIVKAHMKNLGWDVVVAKQDIAVGDKVLFFQIDSAIKAEDARFSFLGKAKQSEEGPVYVISTKKLKGVISQGLALPVAQFPQFAGLEQGTDVTDKLKVLKWDDIRISKDPVPRGQTGAPAAVGSVSMLPMPPFFPITDQMRIESDNTLFQSCKDVSFTVEVKADGSSMSVFWVDSSIDCKNFGVCSHRRRLQRFKPSLWRRLGYLKRVKGSLWHRIQQLIRQVSLWLSEKTYKGPCNNQFVAIAQKYNFQQRLRQVHEKTGRNLVYQGELVGPKLNGNRDRYTQNHFLLFDIWDVDHNCYMLPQQRRNFYNEYLSQFMQEVTVKDTNIKVLSQKPDIEAMQQYATFMSPRGYMAEGIVCKSNTRPYIHFKCVSRQYLLKNKED